MLSAFSSLQARLPLRPQDRVGQSRLPLVRAGGQERIPQDLIDPGAKIRAFLNEENPFLSALT